MSDLLELERKNREGRRWRGTVELEDGDDELEIKHRQLFNDELSHTIDIMGEDTFEEVFDDADEYADEESREKLQRVQELADKDNLSEEEKVELEALKEDEEIAGMSQDMFKIIGNRDIVNAMNYAARCGIKADAEDGNAVLEMTFEEQQERFGDTAKTLDDAMELAEEDIAENVTQRGTGLRGVLIGFQVFMATFDELGN